MAYLLSAVLIVGDQAAKLWATKTLGDDSIPVLGPLLGLRLVHNPGAALSFLQGNTWVVALISLILTVIVGGCLWRADSWNWALPLSMAFGGGIANLIDRVCRPPYWGSGHVVDFLDYAGFFVGNVADIFIVLGVLWVMQLVVRGIPLRQQLTTHPASPTPPDAKTASTGEEPQSA